MGVMKKYHNNLATTRNGKVIMPEGYYYLVSEVDVTAEQIADLTGRLKVANETLVYAAGLKAANQRYREALEEIYDLKNQIGSDESLLNRAMMIAQAAITKTEVKG